jgi:hypothetical protein
MKLGWQMIMRCLAVARKGKGEAAVEAPRTQSQKARAAQASAAVAESRALLRKIDSMEGSVNAVTQSMKTLKDNNGFAALILESLRGGK